MHRSLQLNLNLDLDLALFICFRILPHPVTQAKPPTMMNTLAMGNGPKGRSLVLVELSLDCDAVRASTVMFEVSSSISSLI